MAAAIIGSAFLLCASAFTAAGFGMGAADAFLSAPFCANDIKQGASYHYCYSYDNYNIFHFTLRAASFFSSLSFLMIREAKIATIASTIAQPTIGIQPSPNEPPVNSVPKKNTRKPTV